MTEGSKGSLDVFGLAPYGEAIREATKAAMEGAGAVLGRICLPAAEELGLMYRDKVSYWRSKNLLAITRKLEQKMVEYNMPQGAHAHPRIAHAIVEQGSLADESDVQDMWAGLLSSSCTEAGDDDSNLIFVNFLGALTRLQARVLKYACEEAQKVVAPGGLIFANRLVAALDRLWEVAGERDIQRLDMDLDHLRSLGLIEGGLDTYNPKVVILTPTALALHMYVRCQGSRLSPADFFKLTPETAPSPQAPPTAADGPSSQA
ncbi:MAG TPA: hypothetical protein VJ739_14405 [Gemmataceae bacterium]|nr:hypothetical protein [Gemmataceae bacterium]